jgi:hypothetical protein
VITVDEDIMLHKATLAKLYDHTYFLHLNSETGCLTFFMITSEGIQEHSTKLYVPSGRYCLTVLDNLALLMNYDMQ